jgi:hypothetical protein
MNRAIACRAIGELMQDGLADNNGACVPKRTDTFGVSFCEAIGV